MLKLYSDYPSVKLSNKQLEAKVIFEKKLFLGEYKYHKSQCLCGEEGAIRIANVDRYGLPWPQVICNKCGLVRSLYFLDEKSTVDFYSTLYRSFYLGESSPTEDFFLNQVARGEILYNIFNKTVPEHEGLSLLEVGCGAGGILKKFQDNKMQVTGYDFDENYLRFGRHKGLELYYFHDFIKLNVKKFDIILLSHVLEHFGSPVVEISKLSELLKPKGYFICEVPGLLNIHKAYHQPQMYFQNAHTYSFSASHMEHVFNNNGFKSLYLDEKVIGIFQKDTLGIRPSSIKKSFFTNYTYLIVVSVLWRLRLNPFYIYSKIREKLV